MGIFSDFNWKDALTAGSSAEYNHLARRREDAAQKIAIAQQQEMERQSYLSGVQQQWLDSDQSAAAKQQFAFNMLRAPESASGARAFGSSALADFYKPEQAQKPTSKIIEYQQAQDQGFPGTFMEYQQATRPQGTVINNNAGAGVEKPISISDLKSLRGPDGSTPPYGTTPSQAAAGGYVVQTQKEQDRAYTDTGNTELAGRILQLVEGEGGLLASQSESGPIGVLKNAFQHNFNTTTKMRPEYQMYQDLIESNGPAIARLLGHTGSLTAEDVASALRSMPNFETDSREEIEYKLRPLREAIANQQGGVQQGAIPPPPPGFRIVE